MALIIKQDKFILEQSDDISLSAAGQEIKLNLSLKPNIYKANGANVFGKVSDIDGNPLENALVLLIDSNLNVVTHNFTDSNGNYSIPFIIEGSYKIICGCEGYLVQESNAFYLSLSEKLEVNFPMKNDANQTYSIIAGDLINLNNDKPIEGATVSLYKLTDKVNKSNTTNDLLTTEMLQSIVFTNKYGQYIFREVPQGDYIVKINALGYYPIDSTISVTSAGQIIPGSLKLTPNPNTAYGTISGMIMDINNMPIADATVILYVINSDNLSTPIAGTTTNSSGAYLFTRVPDGNYKVISNKTEVLSINVNKSIVNYNTN